MTLGNKLLVSFLGCGLIPLGVVAYLSYSTADKGLKEVEHCGSEDLEGKAYGQLVAMRDVKKQQIEQYFDERRGDIGVLSENIRSLRDAAFDKLGTVQELKLAQLEGLFTQIQNDIEAQQSRSIVTAGMAEYQKQLETGEKTEEYDRYSSIIGDYVENSIYDDYYVIDQTGVILYSHAGLDDRGTNLLTSGLKDSLFAEAVRKALEGEVAIADFSAYAPNQDRQCAFAAAPIVQDGNRTGVVALRFGADPINEIVQRRDGMGNTGETYLVGRSEGVIAFRSNMQTMGDGKYVVGAPITTPYIERIIKSGRSFSEAFIDSAGNPVYIAADLLTVQGLHWACISKINSEEAIALRVKGESEDFLTKYNNEYGYYDLFLINSEGYIFYTVCHEADYQTNIVSGKYGSSNLGRLVREVMQSKQFGFADFEPYAPSNGAPASFIAQPVIFDGKVEMVVALQMPLDTVNAIMGVRAGMGDTGETYLIGPDKLMRSDSFLDPNNHSVVASFANPAKGSVDTEAARAALGGETGAKIVTDYNGNPVLSAYTPLDIFGVRWALLAEIDESEAMAAVHEMHETVYSAESTLLAWIGGVGVVAAVLVALVGVSMARSISRPINRIIGSLNEGADQVNDAAGQVSQASQQLAEGASEQASSLEETSSSLEQMAAMTRTNAGNATQANDKMGTAQSIISEGNNAMTEANQAMDQISEASDQISKIIKVIEEIAFQTNLLALNAAVEAARAGEHGKGFAVVADEVRNLAQRAATAARETGDLIEQTVQRVSRGVELNKLTTDTFHKIGESAKEVADLVGQISNASNEQSQGVDQINSAVSQMDKVTQANASGAEESASAAEELSAQAQSVKGVVDELTRLVNGTNQADGFKATPTGGSLKFKKQTAKKQQPVAHAAAGQKQQSFTNKEEDFLPIDDNEDISEF